MLPVETTTPATAARTCTSRDLDAMEAIIDAAAQKYRGVIPADCWHEPYMPREELESEIAAGVGHPILLGRRQRGPLRSMSGTVSAS
jgi:hypothetical protein